MRTAFVTMARRSGLQIVFLKLFVPFFQDVQFGDIDYMFKKIDFTVDKETYVDLPEFVEDLHSIGQKYIVILVSKFTPTLIRQDNVFYHTLTFTNVFTSWQPNRVHLVIFLNPWSLRQNPTNEWRTIFKGRTIKFHKFKPMKFQIRQTIHQSSHPSTIQ